MRGRLLLLLGALSLVLMLSSPGPLASPRVAPAAPPRFVPRSFGVTPQAPPSSAFYLQEGGTIAAWSGSASQTTPILRMDFIARASPYSTGYELNGLSDTGDWYQALVTDNWPGCPAGLVFAYEVWNAAGAAAAPTCTLGLSISAGDHVQITMELNCAAAGANSYCITFEDLTKAQTATASGIQPDSGGAAFVNLAVPSNANGYFSGPMTEVVDTSASSCQTYSALPTIAYVIGNGSLAPTSYIPWSDEFRVANSGNTLCYAHFGTLTTVSGSPLTAYTEASGGDALGPHWVAGQDWSAVPGTAGGWRFQTDVIPLQASLVLPRPSVDAGQNVTAQGAATGGLAPYSCTWTVAGTPLSSSVCNVLVVTTGPGILQLHVYLVDASRNYAEAQANVQVLPAPTLQLVATPSLVVLGGTLTITPTLGGGLGPFSVTWSGLPPGCAAATGSADVSCVPTAAGVFVVIGVLTDANGGSASDQVVVQVDSGIAGQPTYLISVLVAGLAAVVIVLFLVLARSRRRQPPPPQEPLPPSLPPPPPPEPTPPPGPPPAP